MAVEILKPWPETTKEFHLPLARRALVKGLKIGRRLAAGELLATGPLGGSLGALRAPAAGWIRALSARYLTLVKNPSQSDLTPKKDLNGLSAPELYATLIDLGLTLPGPLGPGRPLVVAALDAEPDQTLAKALWSEWPAVLRAGLELIGRLYPDRPLVLAWPLERKPPDPPPLGFDLKKTDPPYPYTFGPFLGRYLGLGDETRAFGTIDSRTVYLLGRVATSGRPPFLWPIALQGLNYLVPLGLKPLDLLTGLSLEPRDQDAVVLGGAYRGRPLCRLDEGLGPEATDLRLIRAKNLPAAPGPCRRCQACSLACPLKLPLAALGGQPFSHWPRLRSQALQLLKSCPDCGLCAKACPANRPLRFFTSELS
ncbi:MAG: hypothetical protein LBI10_00875 [Deltaproteobacteria bacterium]|jgi:ferredoxin|nr:hypothetical protein [Deltaproteobacteria bacterium]